jgi:two-component system osmolarity sensor histidine kinase EnvZ
MIFKWLKQYVPRGLYGRAALILILPVVTLQLVVSVVFIQRHFEGVTEQLSHEMAQVANIALETPEIAERLRFDLTEVASDEVPRDHIRRWYDFTGIVVIRQLTQDIDGLRQVAMPNDDDLLLYIERDGTLLRMTTNRERVSASNPHQLLVNMVFFGILMTLIAFVYLRNQLRPITRLAHAAESFGRGQSVTYKPSGALEVRAAGRAFLNMRARIERHIEQRTMMLSGVSHDLRTPITRLRLGLSLLDQDDREPLERDVEEMQRLIDAFLDFARGDSQDGDAEPTDPIDLVNTIVDDAKRGGQAVRLVKSDGQGQLPLRPKALRRALENLIGNAVRYGTTCQVSVALTERSLRISVEDDGPGIPADARDRALRPFVRLDPARNQDRGSGVGLGLAISADIAKAHGGVLRLGESAGLGGLKAEIIIGYLA